MCLYKMNSVFLILSLTCLIYQAHGTAYMSSSYGEDCYGAATSGITEEKCEKTEKNCLWCPDQPSGQPWCLRMHPDNNTRHECGDNLDESACKELPNCRWCPSATPKCVYVSIPVPTVCSAYRVNCATTNVKYDEAACVGFGCNWCPNVEPQYPKCITGEITPTKYCHYNDVDMENCLPFATSNLTKQMCDAKSCSWCPSDIRSFWCVRPRSKSPGTPPSATDCQPTQFPDDCYSEPTQGLNEAVCNSNANKCMWCPDARNDGDPWCLSVCPSNERSRCPTGGSSKTKCEENKECRWCPGRGFLTPSCIHTLKPVPYECGVSSIDCFTTGTDTDEEKCVKFGCYWCPNNQIGQPFCVTGAATTPSECSAANTIDCIPSSTSLDYTFTKSECDFNGCQWCPNTDGKPWCRKISGTVAATTTAATTKAATTKAATTQAVTTQAATTNAATTNNGTNNRTQPATVVTTAAATTDQPTTANPATTTAGTCAAGQQLRFGSTTSCCTVNNPANSCGTPTVTAGRAYKIVGGTAAQHGLWPWQVTFYPTLTSLCGGTIIGNRYILTAAHCTESNPKGSMKVIAGVVDISTATTANEYLISLYINHPQYNSGTLLNDIAILILARTITYGTYQMPVCLPRSEDPTTSPSTPTCYVTGWGTTSYQGSSSNELLQVDVQILSTSTCTQKYANFDGSVMLCAGWLAGGKDSCQGDSGGPLVCQRCDSCDWYLVGVVSFGNQCALPNYPGVYAKVTAFEQWIYDQAVPSLEVVDHSSQC